MSIFLNENSKVIVQGMTGSEGMKHTRRMLASGTKIVGGVNPRKAGQTVDLDGTKVPVFGSVSQAIEDTGADVSVVFVPPAGTRSAVVEAIDAEIGLVVVITEGIPVHDTAAFWAYASAQSARKLASGGKPTRIIGPNCPGLISPGKSNAGIIPADITKAGRVGLVSKSGTLTYQMMYELRDLGFSTAIGIGGDPIIGTTHIDALAAFEADPDTDAIVMIGEIGGDAEERAAAFIKDHVTKPVVGYVAGFTAPEGKTMGHAGAIVSGSSGTAQGKKEALEAAGVKVGKTPSETARLLREVIAPGPLPPPPIPPPRPKGRLPPQSPPAPGGDGYPLPPRGGFFFRPFAFFRLCPPPPPPPRPPTGGAPRGGGPPPPPPPRVTPAGLRSGFPPPGGRAPDGP